MSDYKRGVRWAYAIIFGLCLLLGNLFRRVADAVDGG